MQEHQGLYLYCFFKGPPSLPPEAGIDGANPTFVLSYRDLCALVSYVPPDEFDLYEQWGRQAGLAYVLSGPFVRSSYHAAEAARVAMAK